MKSFICPFFFCLVLHSFLNSSGQVAYFDIKVTPSTNLNPPKMHVKYNFIGLNVPVVYRTCNYEFLPQTVDFYDDSITAIGNYNVYALNALNLRDTIGIARLNLCHPSNVANANWLRIPVYATITNTIPSVAPNCNGALSFTLDTAGTTVNNPKRYYLKDQSNGDTINMHGRSYNGVCSGKYFLDIFQPNICSQCYGYYYRTTYIDGQAYFPHAPAVSPVVTVIGTTGGVCNGSASIQTNGGIPPYTYDFGLTKNFLPANTKNNLCAGIHFVDVADGNGDTIRSQYVINGSSVTNNPNTTGGIQVDTIIEDWSNCSFNFNLPVDSAFVSNSVMIDSNTVVISWNVWQAGNLSQYTDSISYVFQGTNYVSLIIFCGNAKLTAGTFKSYRINDYIKIPNTAVGIKEESIRNYLKIYPNPSRDKLSIGIENIKNSKVIIYDLYGNEVMNTQFKKRKEMELDIHAFNPGVYFIKVQSDDNMFFSGKFIKE